MQMLVFRELAGRTTHSSAELLRGLREALRSGDALDGLLRAGEIECSLADLGVPSVFAAVTDALAYALLHPLHKITHLQEAERRLASAGPLPPMLAVCAPEGFAYYALHPLSYAISRKLTDRAAVIGIRSIGTTLSAVTGAALHGQRITVRPTGHPYNRVTELTPAQCVWIRNEHDSGAEFFVVDEGPGLSGSSFLSTGEALVRAGVPPERIVLVCSHNVDPTTLVAENAVQRWERFRTLVVDAYRCAPTDAIEFSQNDWRNDCFPDPSEWPAVWTQMTGPKLRSADNRLIYKFEGFGRYGDSVRRRSELNANAGFGPVVLPVGDGWSAYERLPGRALRVGDLSEVVIEHIADYVAFRQESFAVETTHSEALEQMTLFNCEQLWQQSPGSHFALEVERPVIADGRMMPYEWRCDGVRFWKLDAAAHGDNHFFPGPVDVAWDLAGAMVEWQMDDQQRAALVRRYRERSGDDASRRIDAYVTAYCAFQAGYAKMAAAVRTSDETPRFLRDLETYRQHSIPRSAAA